MTTPNQGFPLYRDPHFTFRFKDDRIISRIHLEGIAPATRVLIFAIDPVTEEKLRHLARATVGEGGWVDLPEPLVVQAGGAFIAVVEESQ